MVYNTIREIEKIMGRIRTHPEFSHCVSRDYINYLKRESIKHSFLLEEDLKLSQDPRECSSRIELAWKHLTLEGISVGSLKPLGHLVQPKLECGPMKGQSNPDGFRPEKFEAHFGDGFIGTLPHLIYPEMENLVNTLVNNVEIHPVIRAAEAHLQIVRIHPYGDGNGRVARLLQNFCLQQGAYPPAIINENERDVYFGIINAAQKSRSTKGSSLIAPSEYDRLFQAFIASKVLLSASALETELLKRRKYAIDLAKVPGREIALTISKSLKSMGRKEDGQLTISINPIRNHCVRLDLEGDVSAEELDPALARLSQKYHFKYQLTPITNGDCN